MSNFLYRLLPTSAWVLCAVDGDRKDFRTFRASERDQAMEWIVSHVGKEIKVLAANPTRMMFGNPTINDVRDVLAIGIRAPMSMAKALRELPCPPAVAFPYDGKYVAVWRFAKPVAPEKAAEAERIISERFKGSIRLNFFVPVPRDAVVFGDTFAARFIEPKHIETITKVSVAPIHHDDPATKRQAAALMEVLHDYGFEGEIKDIKAGPVIRLFAIEPKRGTQASKIAERAEDIARDMGVESARVLTNYGQRTIGIELPREKRENVLLSDILASPAFKTSDAAIPLVLGKAASGEPLVVDLAAMPHLLVSGTTGSGKSVALNAMIVAFLNRFTPDELRLILIDPARVEFAPYRDVPHLFSRVVTDTKKAVATLQGLAAEMDARYEKLEAASAKNIASYNSKPRPGGKMAYIVVIVDEVADLVVKADDREKIEIAIQRLSQAARKAGIHLILATQRPSVDVLKGLIKANMPNRISFRMTKAVDSQTIIGEKGAEQLLGQGDMLYQGAGGKITRAHGPYISEDDLEAEIERIKRSGPPPSYVDFSATSSFEDDTSSSKRTAAARWLQEQMRNGLRDQAELRKKALQEGITNGTFIRAFDDIKKGGDFRRNA